MTNALVLECHISIGEENDHFLNTTRSYQVKTAIAQLVTAPTRGSNRRPVHTIVPHELRPSSASIHPSMR